MSNAEKMAQAEVDTLREERNTLDAMIPKDGRPCSTDVYLYNLLRDCDDAFDVRESIKNWVYGEWDEAACYLDDETREKLEM